LVKTQANPQAKAKLYPAKTIILLAGHSAHSAMDGEPNQH